MSDKKKQEEKVDDSDTDYGSDTWLADFDVDQFVRNWKAAQNTIASMIATPIIGCDSMEGRGRKSMILR